MTLPFKLGCVWCCLFYFLVYSENATKTSFEIQRGKYDAFQNVQCQTSQSCTKGQCQSYSAECVDNKCERCKCSKDGRNTFVTLRSNSGYCTTDENIIPESGCNRFQNGRFMLYLNDETCHENPCFHQFSASNFSGNRNCSVKWADSEILHSSDAAWQYISYHKQLFSIQRKLNDTKILKVDREALEIFNGSLLRLVVSCEAKNYSKNQCLLLKFKSLQRNTKKFRFGVWSRKQGVINKNTVMAIWVCDFVLFCIAAIIEIVLHKTRRRLVRLVNFGIENRDHNQAPVPPPLNDGEPSTSNQLTQRDSQGYEIPNERLHECVNKKAFTSPQPVNRDITSDDGSLRNNQMESMEQEQTGQCVIQPDTHVPPQNPQYEVPTSHQYEYPDQLPSHQYEYPSLKGDTRVKTDVCAQDGAYSPLVRPPLNENESENGGYTSLIKDIKTTPKIGTAAKKDETNGDYTPLVRPPLKDKESEDGRYTSLIKNEKTSEKTATTAKMGKDDELPYVDATDGDYTPLAKLKPNESKVPLYQPLLKIRKKGLKKPMPLEKQKKN